MRVLDRLVAVLLALAACAAGAITAIEIIAALLNKPPVIVQWHRTAGTIRGWELSSSPVLVISLAVAVVGLLLLWAALHRTRPAAFTLQPIEAGKSTVEAGASRRAFARAAAEQASHVGGVYRASARLRRRSMRVSATTRLRDPGELNSEIRTRVQEWVDGLDVVHPPKISVRLRRKGA